MENQYARALWKMVQEDISPSKAVRGLKETLEKQGRVGLLPRITRAFARIAEREVKKNRIVLSVAREKDERKAKQAVKEVLKEMDIDEVSMEIDETLVGGWRLEGKGILVDASYKKQLLDIYNSATK